MSTTQGAAAPAWLRGIRKPGWPFLNPGAEPRRLRFWRWAQRLAERKVQATWMDTYHHDRVCGGCHRPFSLMHRWPEIREDFANPMEEHTTCPGCGATTTWACYGMLPEIVRVTPGLAEVPGEPPPPADEAPSTELLPFWIVCTEDRITPSLTKLHQDEAAATARAEELSKLNPKRDAYVFRAVSVSSADEATRRMRSAEEGPAHG